MKKIVNAILLILLINLYGCSEVEDRVIVVGGNTSGGSSDNSTAKPGEVFPAVNPEYNMNTGSTETIEFDNGRYKFAGNNNYLTNELVYYDKIQDTVRPIENNLEGSFSAHVEFMQSHNILPSNNSENNQPSLIPYRSGLVLLSTDTFYSSIRLKVVTGLKTLSLEMNPPHLIPESDNTRADKGKVSYSNKTWSAFIPDKFIQPGMELHFEAVTQDNIVLPSVLRSSNIQFKSSSDVTYFFMNIGLFNNAVSFASGKDYMLSEPAKAVTDYYQTVPFGKIVNALYSPQRIDKVIMSDGKTYTDNSSLSNESLFNEVISSQIGSGIILSNKGVVYSDLLFDEVDAKDPLYMVVAHANNYSEPLTNKKGVILLNDTTGNEFSRLTGYNFGLTDDYNINTTVEGSVHGYNTGWGYDAYNNILRGNISWDADGTAYNYKGYVINGFNNLFGWQKDPMSYGNAESSISKYPLYTKLTAKAIQDNVSERYLLSYNSENGYYKYIYWDNNLQKYRYVDDEKFLSNRIEPTETGVPVITVIGGYNNTSSVLYPYFRGNYGNVFNSVFQTSIPYGKNYLKIDYESGSSKYVVLNSSYDSTLKKFHINISQSSKPQKVTLYLSGIEKESISIPVSFADTMPEASIVGRDYGYNMLMDSYIEKLNSVFSGQTIDNYTLSKETIEMIESLAFNNKLDLLQNDVKQIADNHINQYLSLDKALSFMAFNENELNNGNQELIEQLKEYLLKTDYKYSLYAGQQMMTLNNQSRSKCIELKQANAQGIIYAGEGPCVEGKPEQKWFMDNFKRIRSVAKPYLCMPYSMKANGLIYCNNRNDLKWKISATYPNKNVYESMLIAGKCLHYNYNDGSRLMELNCSGNNNQNFVERFKDTEVSRFKDTAVKIGGRCVKISDTYQITTASCPANATELDNLSYRFFMDKKGRIHSSKYPAYCIEASSNMQYASLCSDSTAQMWKVLKGTDNTYRYESVYYQGKCLDDDTGKGRFNIYNCHSNNNQKFNPSIEIDNSSSLIFLSGEDINKIDTYIVD